MTKRPPDLEVHRNARWIWPDGAMADLHNCYAQFRKVVTLENVPDSAPALVTADQSYHLWVNGEFVCRGPARGFQSHWPVDEVDLSSYLKAGRNVIAVRAYQPGMSNFQYRCEGMAGFLFSGQWGDVTVFSDTTWKSRRQTGVLRGTVPVSIQLFPQEHFDARLEPADWTVVDFDDSAWSPKEFSSAAWNSLPWHELEDRGIPLLEESRINFDRCIGTASGLCHADFRKVRDVFALRLSESLGHSPVALPPEIVLVPPTGKNAFVSYLFAFERTQVGSLQLKVSGAEGGEIIDATYFETIDEASLTPDTCEWTHSRIAFGSRLVCRQGVTEHCFFHYYGFKFLVLTIRDSLCPLEIQTALNRVGYPLMRKGSFASSDRTLSAIWESCAWTQQCCMLDAYVDTPWREQAQWWGDARVQARNTFHLSGDTRLFRRGIRQIAAQTTPNGLTYGHAPTVAHDCVLPDFTLIWLLTLWDDYWQTGSLEIFLEHREIVARLLEYFRSQSDPTTGLLRCDPRYWLFLDWTELNKDGQPSVYSLWLLLTLQKLSALHQLIGDHSEHDRLLQWAESLRSSLRKLISAEGLMGDGIDSFGNTIRTYSVHSQTLALITKVDPDSDNARLGKVLIPFIKGELALEASPSAYWLTYVFQELIQRHYGAEVVSFIKSKWSSMGDYGTTWEMFTPRRGEWSHSHAWSAHPTYHLMQTVGGIDQRSSGWQNILFRPVFHGEAGGASIPSPFGTIASSWTRKDGEITVELSLPAEVEAEIRLPDVTQSVCGGNHTWKVGDNS